MAASSSCFDGNDSRKEYINAICKLQAAIRGRMVRKQFQQLRCMFERLADELDCDECVDSSKVFWKNQHVCKPQYVCRNNKKNSIGNQDLRTNNAGCVEQSSIQGVKQSTLRAAPICQCGGRTDDKDVPEEDLIVCHLGNPSQGGVRSAKNAGERSTLTDKDTGCVGDGTVRLRCGDAEHPPGDESMDSRIVREGIERARTNPRHTCTPGDDAGSSKDAGERSTLTDKDTCFVGDGAVRLRCGDAEHPPGDDSMDSRIDREGIERTRTNPRHTCTPDDDARSSKDAGESSTQHDEHTGCVAGGSVRLRCGDAELPLGDESKDSSEGIKRTRTNARRTPADENSGSGYVGIESVRTRCDDNRQEDNCLTEGGEDSNPTSEQKCLVRGTNCVDIDGMSLESATDNLQSVDSPTSSSRISLSRTSSSRTSDVSGGTTGNRMDPSEDHGGLQSELSGLSIQPPGGDKHFDDGDGASGEDTQAGYTAPVSLDVHVVGEQDVVMGNKQEEIFGLTEGAGRVPTAEENKVDGPVEHLPIHGNRHCPDAMRNGRHAKETNRESSPPDAVSALSSSGSSVSESKQSSQSSRSNSNLVSVERIGQPVEKGRSDLSGEASKSSRVSSSCVGAEDNKDEHGHTTSLNTHEQVEEDATNGTIEQEEDIGKISRSHCPAEARRSSMNRLTSSDVSELSVIADMTSMWVTEHSIIDVSEYPCNSIDELQKTRSNVAMELLWVQQAIDSRKNYLRLKKNMTRDEGTI